MNILAPILRKFSSGVQLTFGNDMSRVIRGIAIILMVLNHSLPGKIIGFAVPLFSFLIGYGYAFAKEHNLRNSGRRVWHLLSNYWLVLFLLCLPAALISYPKPIPLSEIALCMFGLNGRLNFYSWFIYFFIFTMGVLPFTSRMIDRYGFKGVLITSLICGIGVLTAINLPGGEKILPVNVMHRCLRYFPIVAMGYWLASYKVFSRIYYPDSKIMIGVALGAMAAIYFLRGLPYAMVFDLLWAPVFAICVAIAFRPAMMSIPKAFLTEMGIKSMFIWFTHALFFTFSTRGLYLVAVKWISWKPGFIIAVLALSYLMSALLMQLVKYWPEVVRRILRVATAPQLKK